MHPADPALTASLTAEQRALVERRYGPPRRRPVGWLVALAVLLTGVVVWVLWATWLAANPAVRWQLVRYTDVTDRSVTVEFTVTTRDRGPATCTIQATSADHVVVGSAAVPVPAAPAGRTVTYRLAVIGPPASADVVSCTTGG
jgi:hypothetical protein